MLRCGIILLLTLAAVTLGAPGLGVDMSTQTNDTDVDNNQDILAMSDVCFFGSPSYRCHLRCKLQNLNPICEEQQGLCVCIPPEEFVYEDGDLNEDVSTDHPQIIGSGDGNSTEDDSSFHMIFYIFDLSPLFGEVNETSMNATEIPVTGGPTTIDDVNAKLEVETIRGWASTHILAMIIVALLCLLIVVELAACLKKQNAKYKEANLFTNSLGIPNKS